MYAKLGLRNEGVKAAEDRSRILKMRAALWSIGIVCLTGLVLACYLSWKEFRVRTTDQLYDVHRMRRTYEEVPYEPVKDFREKIEEQKQLLRDVTNIGKLANAFPVYGQGGVDDRRLEIRTSSSASASPSSGQVGSSPVGLSAGSYPDWVYEVIDSQPDDGNGAPLIATPQPPTTPRSNGRIRASGARVVYNLGLENTTPHPSEQRAAPQQRRLAVAKSRQKRQPEVDYAGGPQYEQYDNGVPPKEGATGADDQYNYYEDGGTNVNKNSKASTGDNDKSGVEGELYNYYGHSDELPGKTSVGPSDAKSGYTPSYDDYGGQVDGRSDTDIDYGDDEVDEDDDTPTDSGPQYVEIGDEDLAYSDDDDEEDRGRARRRPAFRRRRIQPGRRPAASRTRGKPFRRTRYRPANGVQSPVRKPYVPGKMAVPRGRRPLVRRTVPAVSSHVLRVPQQQQQQQQHHRRPQVLVPRLVAPPRPATQYRGQVVPRMVVYPKAQLQAVPRQHVVARPTLVVPQPKKQQQILVRSRPQLKLAPPSQRTLVAAVPRSGLQSRAQPSARYSATQRQMSNVAQIQISDSPYTDDGEMAPPQINVIVNAPAPTSEPIQVTENRGKKADDMDSLIRHYNLLKKLTDYLKSQQTKDKASKTANTAYYQLNEGLLITQQQRQLQEQQLLQQQLQQQFLQQQYQQQQQQQQPQQQQQQPQLSVYGQTKYATPSLSPIYSQTASDISANMANQMIDLLASAILSQAEDGALSSTDQQSPPAAGSGFMYGNPLTSVGFPGTIQTTTNAASVPQSYSANKQAISFYDNSQSQQLLPQLLVQQPAVGSSYPTAAGLQSSFGLASPANSNPSSAGVMTNGYSAVQYQSQPVSVYAAAGANSLPTVTRQTSPRLVAQFTPSMVSLMYSKQNRGDFGETSAGVVSSHQHQQGTNSFASSSPRIHSFTIGSPQSWQL